MWYSILPVACMSIHWRVSRSVFKFYLSHEVFWRKLFFSVIFSDMARLHTFSYVFVIGLFLSIISLDGVFCKEPLTRRFMFNRMVTLNRYANWMGLKLYFLRFGVFPPNHSLLFLFSILMIAMRWPNCDRIRDSIDLISLW